MNTFQTVSHFASFAASAYVMYVVAGTALFGGFVWKNVYATRQDARQDRNARLR